MRIVLSQDLLTSSVPVGLESKGHDWRYVALLNLASTLHVTHVELSLG